MRLMRSGKQLGYGIFSLLLCLMLSSKGSAQSDAGFIYGKVYTIDNSYQGQIRWGKEEAFWNDLFNAVKLYKNDYQSIVSGGNTEKSSWGDFDWRLSSIWEDKRGGVSHQFTCQFGDIGELEIKGDTRVNLKLKNGVILEVGGEGYNDIGTEVLVMDDELGLISINWKRIRKIEFKPTPSRMKANMGAPLYGTVRTVRKGEFTGFIQWDHDERLSGDKLDGRSPDGSVSIAFGDIKQISKYQNGSKVVLLSGREYYLRGSNDVDSGNRGIIVSIEGIGKITVPWKAFDKVEFTKAKNSGESYGSYGVPMGLYGRVERYEGGAVEGRIIYDIDEAWELEILEGNDDEIGYEIPFRNIKKITPKNYSYSLITLRNGETLLLGGGRDISDRNAGLLIFKKGIKDPEHIPWKNITEITFD
ncbi:hypothetical protein C900_01596 [Fulvivirga imtechensis AK7]|uniref:Uncharacterized protein n=1 Tax=Fulvivirga imtechensis AK7 TaxID=1237149 RepID=L8JXG8_9BACT|nr:hypothetical protein [Fulvivirga imtechensis]ELR72314.1 hypothetical protein C900_01596 [Fulvivirga imtechensis AK7]